MRRSYKIALAAVSCAIAVIAVVAQAYISTMSIALNVIAALAISLPLTQKSISGAIFSYVAAAGIGFLAVNIKALPFILFYAPYAIIQYALDFVFYVRVRLPKWVKIVLITIVKLGYFAIAFYACIMLMKIVIADIAIFGIKWTLPLLMVAGLVLFCAYDPLYRFVFVNLEKIVNKYVGGRKNAGRQSAKSDVSNGADNTVDYYKYDGGDVFSGFPDDEKQNEGKRDEETVDGKDNAEDSDRTEGSRDTDAENNEDGGSESGSHTIG